MDRTRRLLPTILLLAGVATLVFLGYGLTAPGARSPLRATTLPEPRPLPEFSLVDQDGAGFSRESLRGKFSLLFFGFTHCPDICPATLQKLAVARRQIADARDEADPLPQILLVSVDPERDSPESLREYLAHFGPGVGGVTGDIEELRRLTTALGIFFEKAPGQSGQYSVNHSAAVLAINEQAQFLGVFSAPHDIDVFVNDIPLLMALR